MKAGQHNTVVMCFQHHQNVPETHYHFDMLFQQLGLPHATLLYQNRVQHWIGKMLMLKSTQGTTPFKHHLNGRPKKLMFLQCSTSSMMEERSGKESCEGWTAHKSHHVLSSPLKMPKTHYDVNMLFQQHGLPHATLLYQNEVQH